jgi:hypothetical protein
VRYSRQGATHQSILLNHLMFLINGSKKLDSMVPDSTKKIYNNGWKIKGILPHNKVKLQDKILNNELPPLFGISSSTLTYDEGPITPRS